jgi:hypothetical protein
VVLALAATGYAHAALLLVPAALLALPLLFGRYPGERVLARLRRGRRQMAPASVAPRGPSAPRVHINGGRLVACGLAGRAPPLLAPR